LVQGDWFPIIKDRGRVREMFRYYRLSPNTKCLHYAEYLKIRDTRPSLEELIEKSKIKLIYIYYCINKSI